MNTKIVEDGQTLAELVSVQIAGPVGRLGTAFVGVGDYGLMKLAMNPRTVRMVHRGSIYNCMVRGVTVRDTVPGCAVRGKVWPRN